MTHVRSTVATALAVVLLFASTSPAAALLAPNGLRGSSATLKRISAMQTKRVDEATPAIRIDLRPPTPIPRDAPASDYLGVRLVVEVSRLVYGPPPRAIHKRLEGVLPRPVLARVWPLLGGE